MTSSPGPTGRRGAAILRAALSETRPGTTLTRSELEERFLGICRDAGVPPDAVPAYVAATVRALLAA